MEAGTGSQHLGRVLQNFVRVKIKAGPAQPQQKPKSSLQPLPQGLKHLETATHSLEVSASSSFCTVIRKREKTVPRKTAKRNFHFQAKRTNPRNTVRAEHGNAKEQAIIECINNMLCVY